MRSTAFWMVWLIDWFFIILIKTLLNCIWCLKSDVQFRRNASHSSCVCVVSHGYGGLGGGRDGGGGWYSCGTKPGGLVAFWEMLEHFWCAT